MLRLIAVTSVVGGVALLVTAVSSLSTSEDQPVGPVVEVASHRTVSALQDKLRRTPGRGPRWVRLTSSRRGSPVMRRTTRRHGVRWTRR
ncbi:hypothetical protein F4560_001431 [Saccharothrix ecbatanensis]|uniref:Uncharacterized protein n=1 Tax=Saccharothrix ecbatanensis TaxID=1105145 RepID=A0A7W9HG65_9PSEU|nr:hypothetical protein [Saccharothrix ecbatanensis]MBB5801663.1 hypothetical protein [Saccharothrix ecbatanensis]